MFKINNAALNIHNKQIHVRELIGTWLVLCFVKQIIMEEDGEQMVIVCNDVVLDIDPGGELL